MLFIRMREDPFYRTYPLRSNHRNPLAEWNGCMFETYGDDLAVVNAQDARFVWTLVDPGYGYEIIVNGRHWVNCVGYFLTSVPCPADLHIEVRLK